MTDNKTDINQGLEGSTAVSCSAWRDGEPETWEAGDYFLVWLDCAGGIPALLHADEDTLRWADEDQNQCFEQILAWQPVEKPNAQSAAAP